jgi:hypothetical protein
MLRLVLFFLPTVVVSVVAGPGVIPPGYEGIIEITTDTVADNHWPSINNRGQVVWSRRSDPLDDSTAEIYLYDNGVVTQITHDAVADRLPDINDAGDIVWSRGIGPPDPLGGWPTYEMVLLRTGVLTRLTYDRYDDLAPRINNNGCVVWFKFTGGGCFDANADIYLYDGAAVTRITSGDASHQGPEINDSGQIVWERINWCPHPYWTGTIMLYSDGAICELTADEGPLDCPDINNNGLIAWRGRVDYSVPDESVFLYRDGATSVLTEWGHNPYLNSRGDVSFNRWHDDTETWQVWLCRRGEFYQVTDEATWSFDGRIDDHGDIAFTTGDSYLVTTNIRMLKRRAPGDLNCDGAVNSFDIDPFVMALIHKDEYQAQYADCDFMLADMNLDGAVNVFDIDPFVQALTR